MISIHHFKTGNWPKIDDFEKNHFEMSSGIKWNGLKGLPLVFDDMAIYLLPLLGVGGSRHFLADTFKYKGQPL